MNIDEYRALKAQEQSQKEETVAVVEPVVEQPKIEEEKPITPEVPAKFKVGEKEYTADEIKELERGNLRNDDYTRKTQTLAQQRREIEDAYRKLNANGVNSEDPQTSRVQELEHRLYDMVVANEVKDMQLKYPDFDAREALEVATAKNLNNLEDAYFISRSRKPQSQENTNNTNNTIVAPSIDKDALEKQLRAKIIAEMALEKDSTHSIIASNDGATTTTDKLPTMSNAELEFCKKTKTPIEEYVKWRDVKKK